MCQCQENLRRVKLDPGDIKPSARGRVDRLLGGSVKQAGTHVGQHHQKKDACSYKVIRATHATGRGAPKIYTDVSQLQEDLSVVYAKYFTQKTGFFSLSSKNGALYVRSPMIKLVFTFSTALYMRPKAVSNAKCFVHPTGV